MRQAVVCRGCGRPISSTPANPSPGCPYCLVKLALNAGEPADTFAKSAVPATPPKGPTSVRLGKYVLSAKLGSGGMGDVWKAWDSELERWVALKLLRHDDPRELERFTREARTAAALTHPNIAAVYEAGQVGGRHYIAMQLIVGRTLDQVPRKDLRRLVSLVRDAAEAVGFAHRHGIVHRDLKPANLMASGEESKLHAVVMDFGLARKIEGGAKLSGTGAMAGTPAYMSPEQTRGRRADARSDVYSLGVTLYELLTGRRPFESDDLYDLLRKITDADPVQPRSLDRRIDRDLDTIVLKCLEKDPARRYAKADALARDLDRWLAGDLILARPAGPIYRLSRKLARRKALAAAVVAILIAAGIAVFLVPRLRRTEGELTVAQQGILEQMRASTEAFLDAALASRRSGHNEKMIEYGPKVMALCREVTQRFPNLAEPHYRLGRMHRALMEDEMALTEQEEALRKERGYAPALYERAILTAGLYVRRLQELIDEEYRYEGMRIAEEGGGEIRAGAVRMIRTPAQLEAADARSRELKARMEQDLAVLGTNPAGLTAADLLCAQGLKAAALDEIERARELFLRALAGNPYLEEAYVALAEIALEAQRYEEATAWFSKGHDRDRGYLYHLVGRGKARTRWGLNRALKGEDPGELYQAAIIDFGEALKLNSRNLLAWRWRGFLRNTWGNFNADRGEDSEQLYQAAIVDFGEALKLNSKDTDSWRGRGDTRMNVGIYKEQRGIDPGELYQAAIKDYGEALKLNSRNIHCWQGIGHARATLGKFKADRGEDPGDLYQEAIKDYGEALKLHSRIDRSWFGRGYARMHWGYFKKLRGEDPEELFRMAIEDFGEALKVNSRSRNSWWHRAALRVTWGNYKRGHGEDPEELFQAAIVDYGETIKLNSKDSGNWSGLGSARANWGDYKRGLGVDPTELYQQAINDFREALKCNSKDGENWRGLAQAHVKWGTYKRSRGEDPVALYQEAIQEYGEALKLNSKNDESWQGLASVHCYWGNYKVARAEDPGDLYQKAIENFVEALKVNPKNDESWRELGITRFTWADYKKGRGEDPVALYREAIQNFGEALKVNSRNASTWHGRATARVNWGNHKFNRGEDPVALYQEAIQDFGEGLSFNPKYDWLWQGLGNARANWGTYKHSRGEDPTQLYQRAVEDFEQALKLNPRNGPTWQFRGLAHLNWGVFEESKGRNPTSYFRSASACFIRVLDLAPPGSSPPDERANRLFAASSELLKFRSFKEAIEGFSKLVQLFPRHELGRNSAYKAACACALLGESNEALDWLEKAVEMGWKDVAHIEQVSDLETLRGEKRYRELVEKLKK